MYADAPPIAADEQLMDRIVARRGVAGLFPIFIQHFLFGGNRRGIGVHRRSPTYPPAKRET